MVGILIVSHSQEVVQGSKKLAEEMIQEPVPIEAVGGTSDGRLGTDSNLIYQTLDQMDKSEGIIVLADMGSSVMNTELACEFFSPDIQKKIRIVNLPLIEGAINCALQASFGKGIDEILASIDLEELVIKTS
ncbi:dihydroxyacetone kinase phosphoryl donor subunit DhaM [Halanaerobaculum tunisiense]